MKRNETKNDIVSNNFILLSEVTKEVDFTYVENQQPKNNLPREAAS
jgi:hypothetical protein